MAVLGQVDVFAGKVWTQVVIGIIVSIIGIRFMPEGMINALTLPSSALVAILVVGVPFFIFGAIVVKSIQNSYVRRAAWAVYAVMLLVLWIYNINEQGAIGWLWIYPVFIVGCVLAFAFDGTLQSFVRKASAARSIEEFQRVEQNTAAARIKELQGALAKELDARKRTTIQNQIEKLKDALKDLTET